MIFGAANITAAPGDLDLTFGSGGLVVTSFTNPPYQDSPSSIQVQPDGKIVVCGEIIEDDPNFSFTVSFFIARYHPNGTFDTSFGTNGKIVAPINSGGEFVGREIALQPDGKIIAVGYRTISPLTHVAVNRYNSDGTLDSSFGTGGKVVTQIGDSATSANLVAVQADGRIIVVGATAGSFDFIIVRYNPNGSLDTSFGDGGKIVSSFNRRGVSASAVLLQPDGKIVAAGSYIRNDPPFQGFSLVRYNADGSLDVDFGVDGGVVHAFPNSDRAGISDAVLQPDGRIVVVGRIFLQNPPFQQSRVIVRYNANGSDDNSFAANGIFTTPNTYFTDDIALQPNGKIVSFGSSNGAPAALRINANGSPDAGFGSSGIATAMFGNDFSHATTGAIQPDGKILLHGQAIALTGNGIVDVATARLLGGDFVVPPTAQFDFDNDGRADISVFRPSDRVWYLNRSTDGFSATQFGLSTDKITPADYDGDGKTDIAVYRNGTWYWLNSSNGSFAAYQFGLAGDVPVPADYTGDHRSELAVFRGGGWWTLDLATNESDSIQFGTSTDKPVVADYDGDGRADLAYYRNGEWQIDRSLLGFTIVYFGLASDTPVVGDYDGDGKADQAVFREGTWYLNRSQAGVTEFQSGLATDIPAPADYDGDGKADAAVFRDGIWYLRQTTSGSAVHQFGLRDDKPVPGAFVP